MSHFKNALIILDLKETNDDLASSLHLQKTFASMYEKKVKKLEAQLKELREMYSALNEEYAKSEIENITMRDLLKQTL